ncbi:hypothetical protein GGTG_12546 [Gaeumannomyces tritici R3-111a-1]|uniref:Uncharacterized protein n=1 Tax=Gaeumannomyces tritici (strain R3-111a-1) TaxID=644352 RepID=J3PGC1_GAET3|nr:hypothetical protein GGTG_12546 [Gaeumannomyces tritici R3-111a-1]EJT69662.1 hypothetical protein GGTG_12546 [Gaeumannomyces tritici R3-111a-1]
MEFNKGLKVAGLIIVASKRDKHGIRLFRLICFKEERICSAGPRRGLCPLYIRLKVAGLIIVASKRDKHGIRLFRLICFKEERICSAGPRRGLCPLYIRNSLLPLNLLLIFHFPFFNHPNHKIELNFDDILNDFKENFSEWLETDFNAVNLTIQQFLQNYFRKQRLYLFTFNPKILSKRLADIFICASKLKNKFPNNFYKSIKQNKVTFPFKPLNYVILYLTGTVIYFYKKSQKHNSIMTILAHTTIAKIPITKRKTKIRKFPNHYYIINLFIIYPTLRIFKTIWNDIYLYTGKPYNIIDNKLFHFTIYAQIFGIGYLQFHALYFYILKSKANEYYVNYISLIFTFRTTYFAFKNYFKIRIVVGTAFLCACDPERRGCYEGSGILRIPHGPTLSALSKARNHPFG